MTLPKLKAATASDADAPEGSAYLLEEQVGHLLRRAHQRATALFIEHIADAGLTPTQYAALVKIGDVGEISQNHLGRLTAMDPATSQGVIRRLQGHGLIEIRPDPVDRRRTLLSLSAQGRALVPRAIERGWVITERTLAPLDTAERAMFIRLLKKLV
jgi:DNA-binding MarR family transcriptional regulator